MDLTSLSGHSFLTFVFQKLISVTSSHFVMRHYCVHPAEGRVHGKQVSYFQPPKESFDLRYSGVHKKSDSGLMFS